MAVNVYEKLSEKSTLKSSCSKSSNLSSCFLKLDYNVDGSTANSKNDFQNKKKYFKRDKVQLHSLLTERKLFRRKTDCFSSIPLAVNIYKANSDEFKVLKRGNKKIRKSVLTLPNNPAPVPQKSTASDVNDSEYFNENKYERKIKPRKKRTVRNNKKQRQVKNVDVYDRDTRYCSQFDIDLDCSSTDFVNQLTGDGMKQTLRKVPANETEITAHDVWAILRNLNQCQFVPPSPMSQDNLESGKTKNNTRRNRSCVRNARLIETETEEIAYISSFVDNSRSQSSLDKITVIDRKDDYQDFYKEIEKSGQNCKTSLNIPNQKKNKSKATRKPHIKTNNLNKLQVHQQQSNNNSITENDQRNEIQMSQTLATGKTNINNTQDENELYKNKSKIQINGITKVVLSKGNNIEKNKSEIFTKTPHLVSQEVQTSDVSQEVQTSDVNNENLSRRLKRRKILNHNISKAVNNGGIKPNKHYSIKAPGIRNKPNDETNNVITDTETETEVEPELKRKRQLKDKMLQFLYKKHPVEDDNTKRLTRTKAKKTLGPSQSKVNVTELENTSSVSRQTRTKGKWASEFIDSVIKKIRSGVYYNNEKPLYKGTDDKLQTKSTFHVQTSHARSKNVIFEDIVYNTHINFNVSQYQNTFKQNETFKHLSNVKQSRAEGKWTNEFIDKIFKRINSGVYYSQDEYCLCRRYTPHIKDKSSQTDNHSPKKIYDQMNDLDLIADKSLTDESLMLIPGFDNTLNELEIETFSKNQIAVKNCNTNVVVQFDVSLPSDPCQALQLKQSFSCIPLAVTENHTKIFKSKIAIINAFLPAELCTILPLMMGRIITCNTKISSPKLTVGKRDSNLSTISELTRCESSEFTKQISYDISEFRTVTSDKLLNIKSIKLFDSIVTLLELKRNEPRLIQINHSTFRDLHKESCMALQIYQPLKKIIHAYEPFNLENYIENLIIKKCLNLVLKMPLTIHYFKIRCYNNNISISMGFESEQSNINVMFVFSNVICNNLKSNIECGNKNIISSSNYLQSGLQYLDKCIVKSTPTVIPEKRKCWPQFRLANCKNKKKNFARLNKKCNSMSNLSKRSTVSIDKITNIDEFVQALGSSKILATVIDGNIKQKILLSLKEMKNWTTYITPTQALLVLLLANKKDTLNVVRYRPIVLQGIAVNRITKSSELDMEIEVIERENLNKLKEYEGISYLPASVENQNNLLEELYWIAKTTASDYQRPFDESSELLLKSLLKKRKKLNPSYLRVMARYVGLGLLKSPK